PLPVVLDINDGVTGRGGRAAVRRDDLRQAVFEREVWARDAHGLDVDCQLRALVLREVFFVGLLDCLSPLYLPSFWVLKVGAGGEERGQALGVPFVEGRHKSFRSLLEVILLWVLRVIRPRPGREEQGQTQYGQAKP